MFCNKTNAENVSMHQFPDDPDLKQKWIRFVYHKRDKDDWSLDSMPGTGHICSDHFTTADYTNFMAKTAGFVTKLLLCKTAVPSVQAIPTAVQMQQANLKGQWQGIWENNSCGKSARINTTKATKHYFQTKFIVTEGMF